MPSIPDREFFLLPFAARMVSLTSFAVIHYIKSSNYFTPNQRNLALEVPNQVVDNPWWPKLVKMVGKQPLYTKGFANVPLDAPGLGVELNEDEIKKHLHAEGKSYFVPTPEWNEKRSHDRTFSRSLLKTGDRSRCHSND